MLRESVKRRWLRIGFSGEGGFFLGEGRWVKIEIVSKIREELGRFIKDWRREF